LAINRQANTRLADAIGQVPRALVDFCHPQIDMQRQDVGRISIHPCVWDSAKSMFNAASGATARSRRHPSPHGSLGMSSRSDLQLRGAWPYCASCHSIAGGRSAGSVLAMLTAVIDSSKSMIYLGFPCSSPNALGWFDSRGGRRRNTGHALSSGFCRSRRGELCQQRRVSIFWCFRWGQPETRPDLRGSRAPRQGFPDCRWSRHLAGPGR